MEESDLRRIETSESDRPEPFYLEASRRRPWWRRIEPWVASPILFGSVIYWAAPYVLRHIFGLSEFDAKQVAGFSRYWACSYPAWLH